MSVGKVTLGSHVLSGWRPIHITRTAGVHPDTWRVVVSQSLAERIEYGQATTLTLTPGNGQPPFSITPVYPIEATAGPNPFLRTLVIVDSRWLWAKRHIHRGYNVRKRGAIVKALRDADEGYPVEKAVLVGDVLFQAWSLKNELTMWEVKDIFEDLTKAVDPKITWKWDENADIKLQLEEFEIDDSGDTALGRLLHFLPGFNYRLEVDGNVTLFSEISADEAPTVASTTPYVEVERTIIDVKRGAMRPKLIRVYFTKEVELRLDFDESGTRERGHGQLTEILNVQRVPDLYATIGGQQYVRASWVTIDEYLVWAAGRPRPALSYVYGLPSQALFRKYRCMNFERPARAYVSREANGYHDPVWAARWDEWLASWRHIFMMNAAGRDRVYSIRPYRAAIWSSEHGVRAPAEVYMDWVSFPSEKGNVYRMKHMGSGQEKQAWYTYGYDTAIRSAKIAPYDVEVIDEENGIIGIIPRLNAYGFNEQLIPGRPEFTDWTPSSSLAVLQSLRQYMTLADDHKMSIILTVVPAAPNNEKRLYAYEVKPDAVEAIIGRSLGPCEGPEMEIRVGPAGGWWTAKFAWADAMADAIRDSFYEDGKPTPEELLCNRDFVKALAEASAAKVYTLLMDRNEGSQIVPWLPNANLEGRLAHITHSMETDGLMNTLLFCPPYRGAIDAWAWLPAEARKVLLRQVQL